MAVIYNGKQPICKAINLRHHFKLKNYAKVK